MWIVEIHPTNGDISPLRYCFDSLLSKLEVFLELDRLVPAEIDYRVRIIQYGQLTPVK